MTIRKFKDAFKDALYFARRDNAPRFVHVPTSYVAEQDRRPFNNCWRVTPDGQVFREEWSRKDDGSYICDLSIRDERWEIYFVDQEDQP